jgi:DNA (cytosine-5)-methyltransferase 3A
MNVLSLFDGMSCGQIALDELDIKVNKYLASEVDKYAIKVTQNNYPNTIQLGNVKNIRKDIFENLPINLLIGGSPCQNLSPAVINRENYNQGLEGDKSSLFYEFVRVFDLAKKHNPEFKFLFENVAGMSDKDKNIISKTLGVEPVMINSRLFSAQDRKRYYWTNIEVNDLPQENNLVLKNVLEPVEKVNEIEENGRMDFWYDEEIKIDLLSRVAAKLNICDYESINRVYNPYDKSPTLTASQGGHRQVKVIQNGKARKLLPIEYERLQTVPDNYTASVSNTQRYKMIGNGWTVEVIKHILKSLKNKEDDKNE